MLRRQCLSLMVVATFLCNLAQAAETKLHSVDPAPPDKTSGQINQLYVQFETPVSEKDVDVACKSPSECKKWEVLVHPINGDSQKLTVQSAEAIRHFAGRGLVTLTIAPLAKDNFARVDVTYQKGNLPRATFEKKDKPKKSLIKPADTCDKGDVCISGSVVPAVGSGPTYSIDSKANYQFVAFGENGAHTFGASASIKTDNRSTADPDSFRWGLPWQYVSEKPYTTTWSLIGMDFDKKAQAMNVVSAPSVTWIGSKTFSKPNKKVDGVGDVLASIGLDLTLGAELGDNFKNDFAVVNKNSSGEGWFFRGVPSANAYLVVPEILKLNKISISSSYTARILTRDELFLETRNTKNPIPKLLGGTRHYLENNISFMLTEFVGFQIKHKFGELPPAFKFANHSVSVGLVYAFAQNRVP